VAVLGSVIDGRPQFVAIVSGDVIPKGPKAGEILKRVAAVAGGGGGGRPEMAQGGGKDASKIGAALAIVPEAVREMLSGNGPRSAGAPNADYRSRSGRETYRRGGGGRPDAS